MGCCPAWTLTLRPAAVGDPGHFRMSTDMSYGYSIVKPSRYYYNPGGGLLDRVPVISPASVMVHRVEVFTHDHSST